MSYSLIHGDCREVLQQFKDNTIDALATDPPYGLSFMNRSWDKEIPGPDYWSEILRAMKPGAYGVVMGGSRTHHRLGCVLEDSGFEIRDCIMWMYGSGFPKSQNVALMIDKHAGHKNRGRAIPTASTYQACDTERQNKLEGNVVGKYQPIEDLAKIWDGYGTNIKPAYEPIFLIRKPLIGTVAQNIIEYGVGALNIDACRIGTETVPSNRFTDGAKPFGNGAGHEYETVVQQGRFPANVCHDGSDEVLKLFPETKSGALTGQKRNSENKVYDKSDEKAYYRKSSQGSAARFFYCSKASQKEREAGLHERDPINVTDGRNKPTDNPYQRGKTQRRNTHTTVKPISLCRWLSRLICPINGTLLDPFAGSGSFGCAAVQEGFDWIGIELEEENVMISEARIEYWSKQK